MNAHRPTTDGTRRVQGHWRPATDDDASVIVAMSAALNVEDPGPTPVPQAHMVRTLSPRCAKGHGADEQLSLQMLRPVRLRLAYLVFVQ